MQTQSLLIIVASLSVSCARPFVTNVPNSNSSVMLDLTTERRIPMVSSRPCV